MNPLLLGILAVVGYVFYKNSAQGQAAAQQTSVANSPTTSLQTVPGPSQPAQDNLDDTADDDGGDSSLLTSNRPAAGGASNPTDVNTNGASNLGDAAGDDNTEDGDLDTIDNDFYGQTNPFTGESNGDGGLSNSLDTSGGDGGDDGGDDGDFE